jgi:hypothetical protein
MAELNEFEQKLQDWLDQPASERNIETGATLMLQTNKNRILYQNVIYKKNFEKVEYELKKYLGDKYQKCDKTIVESIEEEIAKIELPEEASLGKRADHDKLPAEIQAIPNENSVRYAKLRSLHEKVKLLSGKDNTPCDRYPYIKQMLALSVEIRNAWNVYDSFEIGKNIPEKPAAANAPSGEKLDVKRVNANRTYLTRAVKEIPEKIETGKTESAGQQLAEAQNRYNELVLDGQTFDPEMLEKLKAIGILIAEAGQKADNAPTGEQITDPQNPDIKPAAQFVDTEGNAELIESEVKEGNA